MQHPAFELLTPREREVYELVVQGMSNAEIANRLHYSEITIRKRVSSILAKFDLPSRSRLIALSHD
ncbi:response regulator transcription factor [Corynebacterium stercoris]|nr:helix-turn-helix transcriptional regulator [Corynebacterium stercoris]